MSPQPSPPSQSDQSPSPPPNPFPDPELVATPPKFKTTTVVGEIPTDDLPPGSGDEAGWPGEPRSMPPSTRSFPGSTDEAALDLAAEEGYRKLLTAMCEQIVGLSSMVVRAVRARRRELPPKAWIATKADKKAIGEPLARIAARHAPMTGKGSDDVVDGFTAGVAVVGYSLANLELEEDAAGDQLPVDDGQGDVEVEVDDAGRIWAGPPGTSPYPR